MTTASVAAAPMHNINEILVGTGSANKKKMSRRSKTDKGLATEAKNRGSCSPRLRKSAVHVSDSHHHGRDEAHTYKTDKDRYGIEDRPAPVSPTVSSTRHHVINDNQEEKKQACGDENTSDATLVGNQTAESSNVGFGSTSNVPKWGNDRVQIDDYRHSGNEAVLLLVPPDNSDEDVCTIPLKTGEEEDEGGYHDDPYVYSDDSESLSDAYFHPQQDRRNYGSYLYQHHAQHHPHNSHIVTPPDEVKTTSGAETSLPLGESIFPAPRHRYYSHVPSPNELDLLTEARHQPHLHQDGQAASYGTLSPVSRTTAGCPKSPPSLFQKLIIPWTKPPPMSPLATTFSGGTILEDYPVEEQNLDNDVVVWHTAPHNRKHQNQYPVSCDERQQIHQEQQQLLPQHLHQPQQVRRPNNKYQRKRTKRSRRRHNQRRYSDLEQLKQQEHHAREQAVEQVRGQPQELQSCKDSSFAILFVLQFLFVVVCAIRYGCTLMLPTPILDMPVTKNDGASSLNIAAEAHNLQASNSANYTPSAAAKPVANPSTTMDQDGSTKTTTTKTAIGEDGDGAKTTTTRSNDSSSNNDDDMITDMGSSLASKGAPASATTTGQSATTSSAQEDHTPDGVAEFSIDYKNVINLLFASGVYACVISYLTFGFMLIVARSLIHIMLVFSVLLALAWGICGMTFTDPSGIIPAMGFTALILSLWYAAYSWNRIPFASTNLYTALCAMRCTADIVLLGTAALFLSFLWCLLWAIALIGVVNTGNSNDCIETGECRTHIKTSHWNTPTYVFLLFSFYWTNMVIKNITRVTVASAIGTWWFKPDEIHPCCSAAVGSPLIRSTTTSFGSICLGSLVVLPAQTLSFLASCCCWLAGGRSEEYREPFATSSPKGSGDRRMGSPKGEEEKASTASSLLMYSASHPNHGDDPETGEGQHPHYGPSLLSRIERGLRCCNRWSYTYIGMYGYTFAEGGERAIQLFETREWMEIVRDNLIQNILLIASAVIGGSTGSFAVLVEEVDGIFFTTLNKPIITACFIGSILGFVLSNVLLLGVVGSAVNTILVCFAAGPFEFDKNHPRLSREMREVWSQQVWEPAASSGEPSI